MAGRWKVTGKLKKLWWRLRFWWHEHSHRDTTPKAKRLRTLEHESTSPLNQGILLEGDDEVYFENRYDYTGERW